MLRLIDRIYFKLTDRGYLDGYDQGFTEGYADGREDGKAEARQEILDELTMLNPHLKDQIFQLGYNHAVKVARGEIRAKDRNLD